MVSDKLANEFAVVHISVEVIIKIVLPAGSTPAIGSIKYPQLKIVAFNAETRLAVVAFGAEIPRKELLGQTILKSEILMLAGPILNRTISFFPSQLQDGLAALVHPPPGTQASTKMLSISKHFVGVCADIC